MSTIFKGSMFVSEKKPLLHDMRKTESKDSKTIMKTFGRSRISELLTIFGAEVIGTGMILYFGCMGGLGSLYEYQTAHPLQGGIVFGFVVSSVIVAFGHISKAHFNPAVTLCSYLLGFITPLTFVVYILAECCGAIIGFWLLKVTTPCTTYLLYNNATSFCNTVLASNVSLGQGFLAEFLATSLLIFLVCSVWDPKNAHLGDSVAIKFGLVVCALSISAGPYTGASLNPARSLGPALINNVWKDHWLYWIGPLSGSVVTTLLYKYVFLEHKSSRQVSGVDSDMMEKSINSVQREISEKPRNAT